MKAKTQFLICKGCGAKHKKEIVNEQGHLTAFICYECGCTNNIADMSQPIVKVLMEE